MPGQQDHKTPREFLEAVTLRFGPIAFDLAASDAHVAPGFFSEQDDSLAHDWLTHPLGMRVGGGMFNLWLNPPFSGGIDPTKFRATRNGKVVCQGWRGMDPWMAKAAALAQQTVVRDRRILCLTPAAVGTDWWRTSVRGIATVQHLSPRLTFLGENDPYKRDLSLLIFEPGVLGGGEGCWRWC